MINVSELRNGTVFKEDKNLLLVLSYDHIKMGRGSATVKVKVRNLKTGALTERSFTTGVKVENADIEKRKMQFLYHDEGNFYFMDPQSYEQIPLSKTLLGNQARYLKDGIDVVLIMHEDEAISLELPNSVIYEVSETGPGEKGNTVSNVYKEAKLDNSLVVKVPMFVGVGDRVKVDTRTGEYVERVR